MRKTLRGILIGALFVCILAVGFLSPDAMLNRLDRHLSKREWNIADAESLFSYEGTLENRIRALDSWQNGSVSVRHTQLEEKTSVAPGAVWEELYAAGLLPIVSSSASCTAQPFQLESRGVSSKYQYLDIVCETESARLHAILDAQTNQYLKIDFICDSQALTDWMADSGEGFSTDYRWDSCMTHYASLLGLGELRDLGGDYTNGDAIQGFESDIRGTLFAVSFQYAKSIGYLSYRLFARPQS